MIATPHEVSRLRFVWNEFAISLGTVARLLACRSRDCTRIRLGGMSFALEFRGLLCLTLLDEQISRKALLGSVVQQMANRTLLIWDVTATPNC